MKVIYLSNSPKQTEQALDAGCNLILTPNLNDMTCPEKTIYIITGAGFTNSKLEAMKHGYINNYGQPLMTTRDSKYPLAINSEPYRKNFEHRLEYLKAHTKWPYGIYIGGSHKMIEHCIPSGRQVSNTLWCKGFEQTHFKDPESPQSQYIADVWEDITFEMIEKALDIFYDVEEIVTGFKNPAAKVTKKTASMGYSGLEIYGVMSRLKTMYSNWRNIYFDCLQPDPYLKESELKFINMKYEIQSMGLGDNLYAGVSGEQGITGVLGEDPSICKEASAAGGAFLAYNINCRAGIVINTSTFTNKIVEKIHTIKKYAGSK